MIWGFSIATSLNDLNLNMNMVDSYLNERILLSNISHGLIIIILITLIILLGKNESTKNCGQPKSPDELNPFCSTDSQKLIFLDEIASGGERTEKFLRIAKKISLSMIGVYTLILLGSLILHYVFDQGGQEIEQEGWFYLKSSLEVESLIREIIVLGFVNTKAFLYFGINCKNVITKKMVFVAGGNQSSLKKDCNSLKWRNESLKMSDV